MILVVGATGMVGGEVCNQLVAQGKQVRALVRSTADAAKVDRLRALDAEIVQGDLREPESLTEACRGVQAVIHTASAMPFAYVPDANTPATTDRDGVRNLIAEARQAGVEHFVYTSFPEYLIDFPLQDAKRAVEAELARGGLNYTILRPTFFMELWLSTAVGFDVANYRATIYGAGTNPISWISYRDVAKFLVLSLSNETARNATLEVGGPEALSPLQVVEVFERVGGKRWEVAHVPVDALRAQHAAAADPMQKSFSGLMVGYALGSVIDMGGVLAAFPAALTSVEDYARTVYAGAPAEAVA